MKTPDEDLINRWIDGDLPPEEIARLEAEAGAEDARFAAEARRIGDALRAAAPAEIAPPGGDFFNHQVLKRIADEDAAAARASAPASPAEESGWLSWFRLPWLAAAACALLAAFFGIKTMGPGGSAAGTEISSLYTPASGVAATAEYRADLDMTIVTLDGLDEIPADDDLSTQRLIGSRRADDGSRFVFVSADGGDGIVLVPGFGAPSIYSVDL